MFVAPLPFEIRASDWRLTGDVIGQGAGDCRILRQVCQDAKMPRTRELGSGCQQWCQKLRSTTLTNTPTAYFGLARFLPTYDMHIQSGQHGFFLRASFLMKNFIVVLTRSSAWTGSIEERLVGRLPRCELPPSSVKCLRWGAVLAS